MLHWTSPQLIQNVSGLKTRCQDSLKLPRDVQSSVGMTAPILKPPQEHAEILVRVHQALALTSYKCCRMCLASSPETGLCSWEEIQTRGNLALHCHLTDVSDFGFCLGDDERCVVVESLTHKTNHQSLNHLLLVAVMRSDKQWTNSGWHVGKEQMTLLSRV